MDGRTDGSQAIFTSKGSWGRVKEAPTRQIQPSRPQERCGLDLAGRGLIERPQRPLEGFFGQKWAISSDGICL